MITEKVIFSLFLGLVSFKALIEESEMKKFPDNDLLRHLRLVTQDAEKCASVAQQLLNGKRQTRWALCTPWLGLFGSLLWLVLPMTLESGAGGVPALMQSPWAFVCLGIDLVEGNPTIS